MINDKSKVAFKESCNKFKKSINKSALSFRMLYIACQKASMSNNKRRMTGEPMIRKQAQIKAWKNKQIKK